MLKNKMKASTLVLILCIGLMCFTGFGNTTADLTDNSTNSSMVDLHEVELNVVTVVTFEVTQHSTAHSEAGFNYKFSESLNGQEVSDVSNFTNLRSYTNSTFTTEGDVGWQNEIENYNYSILYTSAPSRNPRDGLQCFSLFS